MVAGGVETTGTTSACAENTLIGHSNKLRLGNYLRVRGEYCWGFGVIPSPSELPPRARRIPHNLDRCGAEGGTTSACAENTWYWCCATAQPWNYLRVRGEYGKSLGISLICLELPPRARRIQPDPQDNRYPHGTTSACAENTRGDAVGANSRGNYLRVRGEYFPYGYGVGCPTELPPRARRIPIFWVGCHGRPGTTSACAENTLAQAGRVCSAWNYLRVRGEYATQIIIRRHELELPPRARRILEPVGHQPFWLGTTSACAENTGDES